MTTIIDSNEFEVMKAQMNVLKNFAANHEVISQQMVEATIKAHRDTLTFKRSASIFGMLATVFIICNQLYVHFVLGKGSLIFTIATVLWGFFCFWLGYRYYKLNIHENLMSDSLTETAEQITKWKNLNNSNMLYGAIGLVIWMVFLFFETGSDLMQNLEHAIFVFILCTFVIGSVVSQWKKVNKATDEMLKMIEELKS